MVVFERQTCSVQSHKSVLHFACVFVQPVMLFNPGKIASTSRELLERGIAMVVVGFPATPLLSARARICISASHSPEDLDWALKVDSKACLLCPYACVRRCIAIYPGG